MLRLSRWAGMLVITLVPLDGADRWIRATSEHFELYTPQSEAQARATLQHFERVRELLRGLIDADPSESAPVRVVLFSSAKQFAEFRPNSIAAAFYQEALDRDYIFMGGHSGDADRVATHEYVHLLLRHAGFRPPVWLEEGFAEFYSTVRAAGSKMWIGDPIAAHRRVLEQEKWIPLERLLRIGLDSPEYNTRVPAGIFYAQCWALVHRLHLGDRDRREAAALLSRFRADASPVAVLEEWFGHPLAQIERDLRGYVSGRSRWPTREFPFPAGPSRERVVIAEAEGGEVAGMLALVRINARQYDLARVELEAAAKEAPRHWLVEEALGYLAWHRSDWQRAQEHLRHAVARAPNPAPRLLWNAGRVDQFGGLRSPESGELLARAMRARPQWMEPRIALAEQHLLRNQPSEALALLERAPPVTLRFAARFHRAMGFAEAMLGRADAARRALDRAREHESNAFDRAQNERLASFLARREQAEQRVVDLAELRRGLVPRDELPPEFESQPPPLLAPRPAADPPRASSPRAAPRVEVAEGRLVELECRGAEAWLRIESSGQKLRLSVQDPKSVTIEGTPGIDVELRCGSQSRAVRVEYLPGEGPDRPATVRRLEFR